MHWSMLAKALDCPSHMLRDSSGERIYATFTRLQVRSDCPISEFKEGECLDLAASMSRYGAGIWFSEAAANGELSCVQARLMSSFSKFGGATSNTSLLKGLPEIPPDCEVAALSELPEFGSIYRARRAQALPPAIFECEYEIIPSHDINGVGLLYFAAYPIINDICLTKYAGRSAVTDFSTLDRDVCYFGNSNLDDTLIYRLHRWNADDRSIEMEASISRKSDATTIAHVATKKVRSRQQVRGSTTIPIADVEP